MAIANLVSHSDDHSLLAADIELIKQVCVLLLFVVCCLLFAVCCLLFAVAVCCCCLLVVICWLLSAVCCCLSVVCCCYLLLLVFVGYCCCCLLLFAVCCFCFHSPFHPIAMPSSGAGRAASDAQRRRLPGHFLRGLGSCSGAFTITHTHTHTLSLSLSLSLSIFSFPPPPSSSTSSSFLLHPDTPSDTQNNKTVQSQVLCNLSLHDLSKRLIVQAGGIPPLVSLLRSPDASTQEYALR